MWAQPSQPYPSGTCGTVVVEVRGALITRAGKQNIEVARCAVHPHHVDIATRIHRDLRPPEELPVLLDRFLGAVKVALSVLRRFGCNGWGEPRQTSFSCMD